jgi:hypothetical protein
MRRHYLRQEPDAVVPHVRICGGGAQQWAFLLRLGYVPFAARLSSNTLPPTSAPFLKTSSRKWL